ncbi:MAG: hypothetical protein WBM17_00925 [Anaerolineales bacterium]
MKTASCTLWITKAEKRLSWSLKNTGRRECAAIAVAVEKPAIPEESFHSFAELVLLTLTLPMGGRIRGWRRVSRGIWKNSYIEGTQGGLSKIFKCGILGTKYNRHQTVYGELVPEYREKATLQPKEKKK